MSFETVSEDFDSNDSAGWIASTDVFMLSTVVILAISLGMVRYSNSQSKQILAFIETECQQQQGAGLLEAEIERLKGDLGGERAARLSIEAEVERLRKENRKLIEDNTESAQLAESKQQLEKVLVERNKSLAEFESRLGKLMRDMAALSSTVKALEQERDQLRDSNKKGESKIKALEGDLAGLRQELAESKDTIAKLASRVQGLDAEKTRLGLIANSIVALRGELRNVVFVFDSSGSMKKAGRFEASKKLLTEWVDNLQMDQFAIIDFDSEPRHFSEAFVDCNDQERSRAKDFIGSIEAGGLTRTGLALDQVFERYSAVDTIVLFTDGRATDAEGHEVTKENADQIRKHVLSSHPDVVINTIGIGDYIHKTAGNSDSGDAMEFGFFLQMIAKDHKGVFIGIGDAD